jgi:Flp pilus assembly protein TadG
MRKANMDKRGATAVVTALGMLALVGFAGLAVDTARAWLVEDRLKTAMDAAALVAARHMSDANRNAEATAVFWAQFSQGGGSHSYLGATVAGPSFTPDANDSSKIRIDASATIPTTLFSVISKQTVAFSDFSVAQRAGTGLEVALVLDQTASMNDKYNGQTKLALAKAAVQTLLGILYGSQDTQPNLWVSVVPFARTINIGTDTRQRNWLDTTNMPPGWDVAKWSGCIEALRSGTDLSEASPLASRFRPYFWPSTYKLVGTATGRCTANNAYPSINGTRYCHGDNDWDTGSGGPAQADLNNNSMYNYLHATNGMTDSQSHGPNILCALTPIQPLTASRTTVQNAVNAIQAPAKSGGTTVAAGLQGAWYTLSPSWQGVWQDPNAAVPNTPTLPLPYNTPHMKKVVVILTDGDNNWQPAYGSSCGSSNGGVCSSASGSELLYDAYGRVANKFNTSSAAYNSAFPAAPISPVDQTHADPALGTRFTAVCNAMKSVGIVVYVIGFEVGTNIEGPETASGIRSSLQTCASSPSDYMESPTAANLQSAFTQVANQLASLRLAQ